MTHVARLIEECRCLGATFAVLGNLLKVQGPEPLPQNLIRDLKALKPEVIAELTRENKDTFQEVQVPELPEMTSLARRFADWAGHDAARWKRLHNALLPTYTPAWDRIDGRDILVAWAAARLALSQAEHKLADFESLGKSIAPHQQTAKAATTADVSFWGRLARRLDDQAPIALQTDSHAAGILATLTNVQDRT